MKIINCLLIVIIMIGCLPNKKIFGYSDKTTILEEDYFLYLNGPYVKLPDSVSYSISSKIITSTKVLGGDNPFVQNNIFGYREGDIENGKQEGQWKIYKFHNYDSLGYSRTKMYLGREEYFKNGLRDSIYKIYDKDGKIIYSTYFKNGNGTEKDFYENGQLYYEIKTQNGYFTDTLRLYRENGQLMQKLLYRKDSLVFKKDY